MDQNYQPHPCHHSSDRFESQVIADESLAGENENKQKSASNCNNFSGKCSTGKGFGAVEARRCCNIFRISPSDNKGYHFEKQTAREATEKQLFARTGEMLSFKNTSKRQQRLSFLHPSATTPGPSLN